MNAVGSLFRRAFSWRSLQVAATAVLLWNYPSVMRFCLRQTSDRGLEASRLAYEGKQEMFAAQNVGMVILGTSVIAGICKEGPIIATDGRFIIRARLRPDRPLAYIDGMRKIFLFGPYLVATAGEVFVGTSSFGAVVAEASRERVPDRPLDALGHLLKVRARHLQVGNDQAAASNEVILIGFDGSHPTVCVFAPRQFADQVQCTRDEAVLGLNAETQSFERQFKGMRAQAAARTVQKSINLFIRGNPTVSGGSLSVALLRRSGQPRWLSTPAEEYVPDGLRDVADAYLGGRIQMHLFPGVTKQELDDVARATPH